MKMKIVKGKEQEYKDWYEKNSDPYGRACFTYAERWAGIDEEQRKVCKRDYGDCFQLEGGKIK